MTAASGLRHCDLMTFDRRSSGRRTAVESKLNSSCNQLVRQQRHSSATRRCVMYICRRKLQSSALHCSHWAAQSLVCSLITCVLWLMRRRQQNNDWRRLRETL